MKRRHRIFVHALALAAAVAAVATLPVAWCGRDADKWMQGDLETQLRFANGVIRLTLENDLSRSAFRTGSDQFSGEWLFGTYLMAGIGFGQMAIQHPEVAQRHSELMGRCIEKLLSPDVRSFDREAWGEDPIDGIDGDNAHAAYLGYLNFLLGLHRLVCGEDTYAGLNDRITASLIRNLKASPIVMLETYPGEAYPVDNCFAIGSIGMHQRVTGQDHSDIIERWVEGARERYVDRKTGLLVQSIDPLDGSWVDKPRGSGTAFGMLAVYYADPRFARDLYGGIKKTLARTWLGFGAVREYTKLFQGGGDIDTGPVVFGYGLSTTGFTVAGAKRYGDRTYFKRLFATAHLCGAPVDRGGRREYITGGPLGNAILFAMFTVPEEHGEDWGDAR